MKLVEITNLVKKRIVDMVKTLVPDVKYVRVRRPGLLVMKKRWYSLRREVIPVTDALLMFLPDLITSQDPTLESEVNKAVLSMVYLKRYINSYDIVDYLWRVFTQIYVKPLTSGTLKTNKPEKLISVRYKALCEITPQSETINQIKRIYVNLVEPWSFNRMILNYKARIAKRIRLQLAY